jgi:diphosphomevalonate decarboxylase
MIPSKDSYAIPIASSEHWPLDVLVAVTEENQKSIGSTDAMTQTAISSPFYESWLDSQTKDIESAKHAIQKRDFEKLADASEHNCLKMHATMITTLPAIIYWQPATLAIIHEVRRLRSTGVPVFFTIDAGAQVKLVCSPEATFNVIKQLDAISGITQLIVTKVGGYPIVSTL